MNAVLAIIANGEQAIVVIDREAVEINFFFLSSETALCPLLP
jgi:hypothetical protein